MDQRNADLVKSEELRWQNQRCGAYQTQAYDRAGTRVVLERQFARIRDALRLRPGIRLLDLGCGVGKLLAWLNAHEPGRYHGLDLALNSTLSARREHRSLQLVVGDSQFLPYKTAAFDRVVCNGAAHHFFTLRPVLAEIHRVLVPGGLLVLYEPTSTGFTNFVRKVVFWSQKFESPADLAHKEEFTAAQVRRALVESGFADCGVSRHDFLAYPLSGNYLQSPLAGSRLMMSWLSRLEDSVERWPRIEPVRDWLSWRLLVVAVRP
jgi:ubiquinone/menaquinone biosynthesis C-methylase UbiE